MPMRCCSPSDSTVPQSRRAAQPPSRGTRYASLTAIMSSSRCASSFCSAAPLPAILPCVWPNASSASACETRTSQK